MEIKLVLFLPRDAVSVPVCRQVLDGCLETLGVTRDTRSDIALALSEACGNVIRHAGPGDEYEVQVRAGNRRCVIEVVNTGPAADDGEPASANGAGFAGGPVPADAESGRGLRIIDAVADNVKLSGNGREGTTVHFEKELKWVPGAAGEHLFHAS
jgi:serine/threonine-protein kinase RsbW